MDDRVGRGLLQGAAVERLDRGDQLVEGLAGGGGLVGVAMDGIGGWWRGGACPGGRRPGLDWLGLDWGLRAAGLRCAGLRCAGLGEAVERRVADRLVGAGLDIPLQELQGPRLACHGARLSRAAMAGQQRAPATDN